MSLRGVILVLFSATANLARMPTGRGGELVMEHSEACQEAEQDSSDEEEDENAENSEAGRSLVILVQFYAIAKVTQLTTA